MRLIIPMIIQLVAEIWPQEEYAGDQEARQQLVGRQEVE